MKIYNGEDHLATEMLDACNADVFDKLFYSSSNSLYIESYSDAPEPFKAVWEKQESRFLF